jgi:hypothetical protein
MNMKGIPLLASLLVGSAAIDNAGAAGRGTARTTPIARPTIARSYNQSATRTAPVRTAAANPFNRAAGARPSITSRYNSSSFRPLRGPTARPTMQQTYSSRYPGGAAISRSGKVIGRTIMLPKGTLVDRIGGSGGRTFGRPGTSIAARAIKPSRQSAPYSVGRLQRPVIARVERIQPQFGKQGRGFQYRIVTPRACNSRPRPKGRPAPRPPSAEPRVTAPRTSISRGSGRCDNSAICAMLRAPLPRRSNRRSQIRPDGRVYARISPAISLPIPTPGQYFRACHLPRAPLT